MMNKSLFAACALLAACGSVQMAAPVEDSITPLEQACMRDPLDPQRWERLAAGLEAKGQRERAAIMYLQAASLRTHDARQDYATLKQARDEAIADNTPRTQVRWLGPAMVEVVRTAPAAAISIAAGAPLPRLEISNGNGVSGAAARLARSLQAEGMKTVRLSNMRPFVVPVSRIEYPRGQQQVAQALGRRLGLRLQQRAAGLAHADLRIVLGRDYRDLK